MGDKLEPGMKNFQFGSMVVEGARPTRCIKVKISRCNPTYNANDLTLRKLAVKLLQREGGIQRT